MSTINYGTTTSAVDNHVGGEEDIGMPRATISLFRHMQHRLPNTPASLLDMDYEASLHLTTTMSPLSSKALFSNTILTPTSTTSFQIASENPPSTTKIGNWHTVQHKKKLSPIKTVSSDGSRNRRNDVAYGVNPDGTYNGGQRTRLNMGLTTTRTTSHASTPQPDESM